MEPKKMGALIAQERRAKGMTQKELAEQLNVTDKAVSKWERGLSCPDIALLPRLSELLGVTLNELLNGETCGAQEQQREAQQQSLNCALQYADHSTRERLRSRQTFSAILFSALLFLGGAVCVICDLAICKRLTWSLYPVSSVLFAWLVCFPLLKYGAKGILWSLAALSAGIFPYLLALDRILGGVRLLLPIGVGTAIPSLLYLWGVYLLFRFLPNRKWLAGALAAALAIPLEVAINAVLVRLIEEPLMDVWDWLSVFVLAVLAVGLSAKHIRICREHRTALRGKRDQTIPGGTSDDERND